MCPQGYFSILFPWAGNRNKNVGRYAMHYGMPAQYASDSVNMAIYADDRALQVHDDHGMARTVVLRVDAIGFPNNPESGDRFRAYTRPNGANCRGLSWRPASGAAHALWTGSNPGYSFCWVAPTRDQTTITVGYVSIRDLLTLDQPWTWPPGVYHGTYLYGYGAGRDLYSIDSGLTTAARVFTPLSTQPVGIVPVRLTFRTQPGATQQMQAGHQYASVVTIVFDSGVN